MRLGILLADRGGARVPLLYCSDVFNHVDIRDEHIFSKPSAKYYGSALIALLILVNGSMAEGSDFVELFITRIILIVLAVLYIVAALKILDSYWPAKQQA